MASTAVHIFLENSKKLMRSQSFANFTEPEKDELQSLYDEILYLSKFVYKVEDKPLEYLELRNLVVQIRDLVLEAENVIDLFIVNVYEASLGRDLSIKLGGVKKDLEEIKKVVEQMNDYETISDYFNHQAATKCDDDEATVAAASGEELSTKADAAVVGFNQDTDKIINQFQDDGKPLEIISIVGLPGMGKTTLARKVFSDIRTEEAFPTRAWITVSQTYSKDGLLFDIKQSLSVADDDDGNSRPLGEQLHRHLKDKKYLIVMDDIWNISAWNDIQRSLPNQCNGSKVIFTSRFTEIGKSLGEDRTSTHYMSRLSEGHGWNLFQNRVFGGQRSCPPNLVESGKKIIKRCDGLPLSIVVIAGLLAKNEKTPGWWEQVAQSLGPTISTYREACLDTVAISYKHLPPQLKACFLYLGMFPEDYEIPLRKVSWLLIAEGFVVQETDQKRSLEVIAEGYLNELAERSLVMVARTRSDGAAKTFHVHDLLRDFCIIKGNEEKFLCQIFDAQQNSSSLFLTLNGHRRLYITDPAYQKVSSEPSSINLRSLVCFASDRVPPKGGWKPILREDHFKLLQVLDLLSISIPFPSGIGNLFHLKYLALWSEKIRLPPSIGELLHLETLILSTKDTITLPRDIWKMVKLRHIYNPNGMFHFESPAQSHSTLENLQTVYPLCACKTCLKMLERTPGVKKLGLRGSLISREGHSTIPDLSFLKQLESLKCTNTSLFSYRLMRPIIPLRLPTSLKRLTLQGTLLHWKEISVLGELENLEVLKLLDRACYVFDAESEVESDWDTSDQVFSQLKYLKMQRLNITKWDDSNLGFQSLEVLVLEECPRLELLPFDLAQAPSLRMIEVTRCNPAAETCAREIEEEHKEQCSNDNLRALIVR